MKYNETTISIIFLKRNRRLVVLDNGNYRCRALGVLLIGIDNLQVWNYLIFLAELNVLYPITLVHLRAYVLVVFTLLYNETTLCHVNFLLK